MTDTPDAAPTDPPDTADQPDAAPTDPPDTADGPKSQPTAELDELGKTIDAARKQAEDHGTIADSDRSPPSPTRTGTAIPAPRSTFLASRRPSPTGRGPRGSLNGGDAAGSLHHHPTPPYDPLGAP